MLAKLQNVHDMELFLTGFESQMVRYQVPEEFWVSQLTPLLDVKSANFQGKMPADEKDDFETVKKALVKLHGLGRVHYRTQWKSLKPTDKETYMEYFQRICQLGMAWKALEKETWNVWMRETFLNTIEADVHDWVVQQDPPTGERAVELADNFCSVHPRPVQQEGEQQGRYPRQGEYRGRRPRRTENTSYQTKRPPNETGNPQNLPEWDQQGKPLCFRCKKYGHMRRECTVAQDDGQEQKKCLISMKANESKQGSHDQYPGEINRKQVKNIFLDSGCNLSQVNAKWVPEHYRRTGTALLKGIHTTRRCPLMRVKIRMQGRTFHSTMAVRSDMEYDAILGVDVQYIRALYAKERHGWPQNSEDSSNTKPKDSESTNADSEGNSTPTPSNSRKRVNHRRRRRRQPTRNCAPPKSYVPGLTERQIQKAQQGPSEKDENRRDTQESSTSDAEYEPAETVSDDSEGTAKSSEEE